MSEKDCTSDESFTCIVVPNPSDNQGSTNDKREKELEDGFNLHRFKYEVLLPESFDPAANLASPSSSSGGSGNR
ncbi:hypothetical protein AALP_AA1G173900 [Arabis alpina]|uniref:Uncharacterized protein n=1 Tax=Arabis alpina TaxID=50452 RepID=A0A087HNU5_ARAAL|nr:hypothetical protein AALP_AA1G173900 [Arabis alpina]